MTTPPIPPVLSPLTTGTLWPLLLSGAVNFLIAVAILVAGWMLSRWAYRWMRDGLHRAKFFDPTLKPLTASFVRYTIVAITLVAVLQQFGVQTTSLIAVLGAAGLAIGLAIQGTLANVASGVMLLMLRPFRVREKIVVGDVRGIVREIGLFRTIVITDDGVFVSVPNATIFAATIYNNTREAQRRTAFNVDIDQSADLEEAITAILAALGADARVLQVPAPMVQVASLAGGVTTLSVQAWVNNVQFGDILADLMKAVRVALTKARIAPPQQTFSFASAEQRVRKAG
jgi:small conductance mechanosensitive channel